MQLNDFPKVLKTFRDARRNLGEILSSCEFIDGHALKCVTENLNLTRFNILGSKFLSIVRSKHFVKCLNKSLQKLPNKR